MYGSGAVSCSCSLLIRGPNLARCQAEAPFIALCRFSKPALPARLTELLPLVRSSRQRALASSAVLKYGCRQPLVHRSSMLLATSSQTPAESRNSRLMKLSTRGCLRSFVTSKCTSCCGIDLDQMSARYLSVYFHNVEGA